MDRILVTGAAGFIGSHLVEHLLATYPEAHILSYDALTYAGNLDNLSFAQDNPRHEFVRGDICNASLLTETLQRLRPDVIFHLAAETHVDRSIAEAQPFIRTNIEGQSVLLISVQNYYEALSPIDQAAFRLVHISTDEVFGALGPDDAPFCEATPYDPRSPYSASKAAGDHLTRSWYHTYGLPVIIMNCSNNYGPRQFPEKLIPLMISKALSGEALPVYGDGSNIRDWLYVGDHCRAMALAALKGSIGETYCIGGNNEQRNIDIVKHICALLDEKAPLQSGGSYADQISFVTDRPGHDFRYAINANKAKHALGWQPKVSFDQGLAQTVDYYLSITNAGKSRLAHSLAR